MSKVTKKTSAEAGQRTLQPTISGFLSKFENKNKKKVVLR